MAGQAARRAQCTAAVAPAVPRLGPEGRGCPVGYSWRIPGAWECRLDVGPRRSDRVSGKSTSSEALGRVRRALRDFGALVELYDYLLPLSFPLRRLFAQYQDRTQVDLTVGFAPIVNLPRNVVLYDPEGAVRIVGNEALDPRAEEVRVWACQAWEALANVGKYVRRSSYWEAHGQLDEARANMFRLWALAEHVPQARYGLTALVDAGARMPPGIDKSIAGASVGDLLSAARYLADVLIRLQHRLSSNEGFELPVGLGAFVAADLAHAQSDSPRFE